jgi:predicted solute-binding protein
MDSVTPGKESDHASAPRAARVARIPYLNTAPYYLDWEEVERLAQGRWTTAVLPPRQIGLAAEAGEVDAGVMPIADLFRLEHLFEPLILPTGDRYVSFGIANRERVDSVLLFVRGDDASPPVVTGAGRVLTQSEAASLAGARIAITAESSTSFRLLRLLLEVRYGVHPASYERVDLPPALRTDPLDGLSAALSIGDQALRWKQRPPNGFYPAMDLAGAWHAWTGLPFVFARWAVRRDLPPESKSWLARFLQNSLSRAEGHYDELVRGLPADLGPPSALAEYLRNFTYRLGPEELTAVARFRTLLDGHGIVCSGA